MTGQNAARGRTSIGIILCAEKNHVDVELSLDGMDKPIGVADYRLIIPQEDLKQVIQDEIQAYDDEKKGMSNWSQIETGSNGMYQQN